MTIQLPANLEWLRARDPDWVASMPDLLAACAQRWQLQLHDPYDNGCASLVMPATRADGSAVILKLQWPHPECEHEAEALRTWGGTGAVQLLDHDAELHALLLERCEPGDQLSSVDAATALRVFADLLPQLWVPAGAPFTTLEDEAREWHLTLRDNWVTWGRPFDERLLDQVVEALQTLPVSQGEQVLLHQDLHADNVLRAQRQPWLAIDPKPLVGEREFSLAPIVRSFELGHSRRDVLYRLDSLSGELGLDRERARLWTIAQTIAWCFDSSFIATHVETAGWLAD